MLRFNLGGFPVSIHGWFWLTCFLLGGGIGVKNMEDVIRIVIWIAVVFVSILIHELGHALAARKFGAYPEIQLHGLGGLTIMHQGYFTRTQDIATSAAGPAASFLLGLIVLSAWLGLRSVDLDPYTGTAIVYLLWVNFFWTAINLLPILPMDGGQILRGLLGPKKEAIGRWIGVVVAGAVAVWAIANQMLFLGILMGIFAFSNLQSGTVQGGVKRD